jgi:hypothetical protein
MEKTQKEYVIQRDRAYRNAKLSLATAVAGIVIAAGVFYNRAYEPIPAQNPTPAAEVAAGDSLDSKVVDGPSKNNHPKPYGALALGFAVCAAGMAAGAKYTFEGVKADQNQFGYHLMHR